MNELTSPEHYAKLIVKYAECAIGTSLIPGELYEGLATFLRREFDQAKDVDVDVVVHALSASLGKQQGAGLTKYSRTSELDGFERVLSSRYSKDNLLEADATMIFMRGHQPQDCLTSLGSMCNVNPLFFLRHLEYRWACRPLKLFASRSLPSASLHTIRLPIVTLGEREEKVGWGGNSHVQSLRGKCELAMTNYLHDVTREFKLQAGNSIVRAFNVHTARYFSIEQEVTVTVQARGNKWLGKR